MTGDASFRALQRRLDAGRVLPGDAVRYLGDETESRGLTDYAAAVVLPETVDEVAGAPAWYHDQDVPLVPRGGGTASPGAPYLSRAASSSTSSASSACAPAIPSSGGCTSMRGCARRTCAAWRARTAAAAKELFALATRLGGAISGEHGIDWVKRGQRPRRWSPRALELHAEIKRAWDPEGLLNPGKKV
jgi:FAD/FMN-containing dehydrogenase